MEHLDEHLSLSGILLLPKRQISLPHFREAFFEIDCNILYQSIRSHIYQEMKEQTRPFPLRAYKKLYSHFSQLQRGCDCKEI